MTILHDNEGNAIDGNNPLAVDAGFSTGVLPSDIQSHLQTTIQTHNAVSVAATSGYSADSTWRDSDGFDKVAVTVMSDSSDSQYVDIQWSNDNSTVHAIDGAIITGTWTKKAAIVDTKARYFKVAVGNLGSVAHTVSAWAYLKA